MKDVFSYLGLICFIGFAVALAVVTIMGLFIPAHRRNFHQAMGDADLYYWAKMIGIGSFAGFLFFGWLAE